MENNKNMRELHKLYLELGHEVFEEKFKKAIKLYSLHINHNSANVISMHSLNTIIADDKETSPFDTLFGSTLFTTPMVRKEPPSTECIPFEIPFGIIEKVMNDCYIGDGIVHPSVHLLKLTELCEFLKLQVLQEKKS